MTILGDSKITADGNCSHEVERHLFLWRKGTTNRDSILKSKYITLLTKAYMVKAVVIPVIVMYGHMSRTIKKAGIESEVTQSCSTLQPHGL